VSVKTIYQTLEDRNNPDQIEADGPFKCKSRNAWLGFGYYFWESFIDNAHWWGKECGNYEGGYVICKAKYDFNEELCFNLIDNPEHIKDFKDTIELIKEKGLFNKRTTVSRIISYLKDTLKIFNYEATRVFGIHSKNKSSEYSFTLPFKPAGNQYLDLTPAIQICFYSKQSLSLRNYHIIFPDEYIEEFVI
jgi:hypothetical protein